MGCAILRYGTVSFVPLVRFDNLVGGREAIRLLFLTIALFRVQYRLDKSPIDCSWTFSDDLGSLELSKGIRIASSCCL